MNLNNFFSFSPFHCGYGINLLLLGKEIHYFPVFFFFSTEGLVNGWIERKYIDLYLYYFACVLVNEIP